MNNTELSLKYLFREGKKAGGEKSPLLLLLHGIGSNEHDLFALAPHLDERFFVVSCRAPIQMDYLSFAWFELFFTAKGTSANLAQAEQSRQILLRFIDELVERHNLDAERVFLCGFSQGAIMSFAVALTEPEKLAGIVVMSGRMVTEFLPEIASAERLKDFPMLVTHGTMDSVLPIENGRASRTVLEKLPVALEYREYEMAHQVSEESLDDVVKWLGEKLNVEARTE